MSQKSILLRFAGLAIGMMQTVTINEINNMNTLKTLIADVKDNSGEDLEQTVTVFTDDGKTSITITSGEQDIILDLPEFNSIVKMANSLLADSVKDKQSEELITDLYKVRNYFGKNDKDVFAQSAFTIVEKAIDRIKEDEFNQSKEYVDKEAEFDIMEFKDTVHNRILKKGNDGYFREKEYHGGNQIYFLLRMPLIVINSVKRNSDGVIFTVDDMVKETATGMFHEWNIKDFTIKDNSCFAEGVNINNIENVK